LVKVDGFKEMVSADVAKQQVVVKYDPAKTNPEELAKAITEHSDFEGSVVN
jgi:copper chaperone CopZ